MRAQECSKLDDLKGVRVIVRKKVLRRWPTGISVTAKQMLLFNLQILVSQLTGLSHLLAKYKFIIRNYKVRSPKVVNLDRLIIIIRALPRLYAENKD